jgi:hypothetical protein
VLLPGWCPPRRGDATEVIGAALVAKARGLGWRRIATLLGRPPATVRAWLRRVPGSHLEWLRRRGVQYAATLEPQAPGAIAATGSELGDALAALSAAVVAWRRRFARQADQWTLIGTFTGGLLQRVPAD